jgi:hypothetical protein
MTASLEAVMRYLAGFAVGVILYALVSGSSLGDALLWGLGTAAITVVGWWAATLSNDKPRPERRPPS